MCEKCNVNHSGDTQCYLPVIQQNTDDVFFGISIQDELPNLSLKAGVDLTSILKKIDYKLGDIGNSANYGRFDLSYLASKYTVNTVKKFSEAVSQEFSFNNSRVNQLLSIITQQGVTALDLNTKFEKVRLPEILDNGAIGFTVNDNINTVLQKVVNKIGNLQTDEGNPSLIISAIDTNTVDFTLSGVNNTTIKADARISSLPNNKLQKYADGLYVSGIATIGNQSLSIRGNQLSISDGNTITIPVAGLQTLQRVGNNLTISGGNTITLPETIESTLIASASQSIVFSQSGTTGHNISATVKISSSSGNRLLVNSDGLYVQMNATDILNQIALDNTLKNTLCSIVSNCISSDCYKWYIQNTSSNAVIISFTDVNGAAQTLSIAASASGTINGLKIFTNPSNSLIITFQGKC